MSNNLALVLNTQEVKALLAAIELYEHEHEQHVYAEPDEHIDVLRDLEMRLQTDVL